MGEGDTHGYPGRLPQRKGDSRGLLLSYRSLKAYQVHPSEFSSTKLLGQLIRDTEEMYTVHFGEQTPSLPSND
jgi:hypothetical protein